MVVFIVKWPESGLRAIRMKARPKARRNSAEAWGLTTDSRGHDLAREPYPFQGIWPLFKNLFCRLGSRGLFVLPPRSRNEVELREHTRKRTFAMRWIAEHRRGAAHGFGHREPKRSE